jgi:hypothetical protein
MEATLRPAEIARHIVLDNDAYKPSLALVLLRSIRPSATVLASKRNYDRQSKTRTSPGRQPPLASTISIRQSKRIEIVISS